MKKTVCLEAFLPVVTKSKLASRTDPILPEQDGGMLIHSVISKSMVLLIILYATLLAACGGGGNGGGNNGQMYSNNPPAPAPSVLSGKVTDKNGAPVSGITISAYHHNDHTTVTAVTDSTGAYSFSSGLSAGQYTSGAWSDYIIYAEKDGYGFVPSVSDPAGVATRMDFNGLYKTVARFAQMPTRDVSNVNFTALRAGDNMVSLARTGEMASYASGDDYSVRAGVAWPANRFIDNQNGSITDNLTGLVWLKNAGCFSPADWSTALVAANQLASGQCSLTDGSTAGQWRMPNINELESLVDVSQTNPSVSAGNPFANINLVKAYWSSTTYTALPSNAMAIRFTDGRWINGIDSGDTNFNNTKSVVNALWAVKSGGTGFIKLLATGVFPAPANGSTFGPRDDAELQIGIPLPYPRFVDNGNGTLSDTATGLVWLKKADCINQPWENAITAINDLASGQCGLTDGSTAGQWRMPNRSEMLSLSDRAPTFPQAAYLIGQYQANTSTVGPIIFNNFMVSAYYWTSTTDAAHATQAWTIYSCDFGVYNIAKANSGYSLAVR